MLRRVVGWGGGDVNVPCTCTQVKHCLLQFARTFAKNGPKVTAGTQAIDKMWGHFDDFLPKSIHNKSKATRLINDQIWESICTVGNGDKMRARTCGPTCTKCLLSEKKTPLIRYSNSSAPLTRTPPCLRPVLVVFFLRFLCYDVHSNHEPNPYNHTWMLYLP